MRKALAFKRIVFVLLLMRSTSVFSVGPLFWEQSSFRDFQQGKVMGCSIAHEGRVTLAPKLNPLFSTDQVMIWSVVADLHGNLFLGTGHSGKVFKVDPKNQGKLFYTAKELDVFALAVDSQDNLFVGTSPDGKVFKVSPEGTATEFFNPHAKYIWSMVLDRDGNLFVGTGDQGKIYKVDPTGKGSVFYETKQTHVMALNLDSRNNLLAGSFPEGILFRITPAGKGFVLYDAPLQEVHAIEVAADGSIYIGCLNEKLQRRLAPTMSPQPQIGAETLTAPGVTITVTDASSQATSEARAETMLGQSPFGPISAMVSAIFRIAPDLSVETLWSSRDESVFGLLAMDKRILFSTDTKGRLYEIFPNRRYSLLAQSNESQASQLIRRGQEVDVATSNVGKLYQLESGAPLSGTVESSVKDTQLISKWGIISWNGNVPPGTSIQFFTRSGNSDKPDSTWSDWSAAYTHSEGEQITSPAARFIQWKAELKGSSKDSPWLDSVTVAYLSQNIRPEITSVTVVPQGLSSPRHSSFDSSGSTSSDGDAKSALTSGEASANITVTPFPSTTPSRNRVTINWQAEDKNHDTLEYSIYIRGIHESNWRLLKKEFKETSYALDPETLPDGKYRVRIVASDAPSNPPSTALISERESEVFLIDNTPPKVEVVGKTVEGDKATIHFRATDAESNLRRAEFSIDGGKWQMTESDDGIVDSMFEEFTLRAADLSMGEHVVTLRVYDSSGNAGLAKALINISKK